MVSSSHSHTNSGHTTPSIKIQSSQRTRPIMNILTPYLTRTDTQESTRQQMTRASKFTIFQASEGVDAYPIEDIKASTGSLRRIVVLIRWKRSLGWKAPLYIPCCGFDHLEQASGPNHLGPVRKRCSVGRWYHKRYNCRTEGSQNC